jgi:hypothetical protein
MKIAGFFCGLIANLIKRYCQATAINDACRGYIFLNNSAKN